ncbi:MAG: 4-hydroxy-tetrahydrodipicolinate reductase [Steroidobacteraceae bacterium]
MSGSNEPIRLVILGAPGRMGLSLLQLLPEYPAFRLQAAVAGSGSSALGRDSGELAGATANGVRLSADLDAALAGGGLAIDFSTAAAAATHLRACAAARVPLLLGTTGLGGEIPALVADAARSIPVMVAANTSVAVAVLHDLVRTAAARLGSAFDIQIHDTHHASKRDAPSGTALTLGAAASEAAGIAPERIRHASTRVGEVVGDHEVQFLGPGERLTMTHSAADRSVFARGALRAGYWLARQSPGSYGMADVLREK